MDYQIMCSTGNEGRLDDKLNLFNLNFVWNSKTGLCIIY